MSGFDVLNNTLPFFLILPHIVMLWSVPARVNAYEVYMPLMHIENTAADGGL